MSPAAKPRRRPPEAGVAVRAYIAAQPPRARRALTQLRATSRALVPHGVEVISYRIPAVKLDGRLLLWFAGWKEHASIYPLTAAARRRVANQLGKYETSKGTIRFPLDKPLPLALVRRIVRSRVEEVRAGRGMR